MSPIAAREANVTPEFDRIGAHYDRLTGMSPGYAQQLYTSARTLTGLLSVGADRTERAAEGPGAVGGPGAHEGSGAPERRPLRIADMGCGSGTSTAALVRALTESGWPFTLEGIDGSAGMLAQARRKTWPAGVTFRHAQAQDLVAEEDRYDAVFAAYLVRNVPDKDAFLRGVREMLRPGGVLVVHDYGVNGRPLDVAAWTALCWGVVIPSAWVVTRRPQLFTYLWRSVLEFDTDEQLRSRLTAAGFVDVGQRPVPGWQRGMVRATWGVRP